MRMVSPWCQEDSVMAVSDKEDRDNWVRLTLRLPPDLHEEIASRAEASLNTTIIKLLEDGLSLEEKRLDLENKIEAVDDIIDKHEDAARAANDMAEHIGEIVRESVREEIEGALADLKKALKEGK